MQKARPAGLRGLATIRLLASAVTLALLLVGCGETDETATEDEETAATGTTTTETGTVDPTAAELTVPRIAYTSPVQPTFVNTRVGPLEFGPQFGLDFTEEDLTVFESHSTATQTALSGRADIVGGSFISHALVREAGQDFQVFCPFTGLDDFVIAGRNGVDSIDDLFDPETRVAVDSPGGAGAMILNAMLAAADAPGTVADLPNTTVLESSGLRTTAFAANEVDATVIHLPQFNQAAEQATDAVIVSALYEDVPIYIKEAFAAPADWLEQNREAAVAFCASIITANRELRSDFDAFAEAVNTYVEEPPAEEELQELFELIENYDIWPTDGGLSDEAVEFMLEVGVTSGVLTETQDPDELIARDILDEAVALADSQ